MAGYLSNIYKFLRTGFIFTKYVKKKYPKEWEQMRDENVISKALLPFRKGTITYFIYKSEDNLGDDEITRFRKQIKQHTVFLIAVYPISFIAYVIVVFWLLEKMSGGWGSFRFFWS
jgi:hypothetical protein